MDSLLFGERPVDWNDHRLRESRTIIFRVAGPRGWRASATWQPKSRRDVWRCSRASHNAGGSKTEPQRDVKRTLREPRKNQTESADRPNQKQNVFQ